MINDQNRNVRVLGWKRTRTLSTHRYKNGNTRVCGARDKLHSKEVPWAHHLECFNDHRATTYEKFNYSGDWTQNSNSVFYRRRDHFIPVPHTSRGEDGPSSHWGCGWSVWDGKQRVFNPRKISLKEENGQVCYQKRLRVLDVAVILREIVLCLEERFNFTGSLSYSSKMFEKSFGIVSFYGIQV